MILVLVLYYQQFKLNIKITQKNYLIGLQYTNNKKNKRNLYNIKTKKLTGVIEYEEVSFDLNKLIIVKNIKGIFIG